jgi:hypothetical protein
MHMKGPREGSIVFSGLNYFSILFLLLTRRYDVLARHCVCEAPAAVPHSCGGGPHALSRQGDVGRGGCASELSCP